jgi:hypothetical protein
MTPSIAITMRRPTSAAATKELPVKHTRPLCALLLLCAWPAAAQSVLSGTVYGNGSPLTNTLVEALTDGTTVVVGSSASGANGTYSISLPNATYDLRVTPPQGSGFTAETIQNVVLSADRTFDVLLVSAASSIAVSGTVTGYLGAAVPNVNVSVYTPAGQTIGHTQTDATGHYHLTGIVATLPSAVSVEVSRFSINTSTVAPARFTRWRENIPVSGGAATFDVALPVAIVTGQVQREGGVAIPGASVSASSFEPDDNGYLQGGGSTTADASGDYSLLVLTGANDFSAQPPSGVLGVLPLSVTVPVSGNSTRNLVLPSATTFTVSGTVTGYGGAVVANANVSAYTSAGQTIAHGQTDAAGHYSVTGTVATLPSAISIEVSRFGGTGAVTPSRFTRWRENLPVSGSTATFDVALPVAIVTGQVQRENGTPVAGATVSVSSAESDASGYLQGGGSTTADGSGHYSLLVFTGANDFFAQPPSGTLGLLPVSVNAPVLADSTRNLVLPSATTFTVSGTVTGLGGAAVPNASVFASTGGGHQTIGHTQTDETGHYSVTGTVATLPATINVEISRFGGTSAVVPSRFTRSFENLPVSGDSATVDVALPVVVADGVVTDSNGAPVPNVSISGSTHTPDSSGSIQGGGSVSSDASGQYRMLLTPGDASFSVSPPSLTGFLAVSVTTTISGDITQRIVLQKPDLLPPQITSGPFVVHLSDTSVSISWTTNEPATSTVMYGIGSPTSTNTQAGLSTSHTVTLIGLTPTATYQYQVSSSDQVGNGPTVSAVASFATQASPGDVTPPLILTGPTVAFVDQTTAIIQWTTDEPADSVVAYGQSEAATTVSGPAGVYTQTHSLTLTGLQPSTTYLAQVSSADPDGNETTSSIFSLTTLAEPDTTAPAITSGPVVESLTDNSIVVTWETDEPATSGVSYNDGSEFFVVADASLTRTHRMTLSGLRPQTPYNITASSTDAAGNGPTLAGPIIGTTTATPDTTAPALSNIDITDITTSAAVISWTTDETSTSMVRYGIASGAPDNTRTDLTPVTAHSLTVTGLAEDTVYFLVVASTDASGNTATSVERSFRTQTSFVDQPPTKPGPITAPALPTNAESFELTWGASVDDVSLAGYEVVRDGAVVAFAGAGVTTHQESGIGDGVYVYEVRALDSAGHAVMSDPVTVTVDRTPPQVSVPAHIAASTTGTHAVVPYEASAFDSRDGTLAAACMPAPGSAFSVGDTLVTCSATDTAGNTASASFTVTVTFTDTAPPAIASVVPSQASLWPPNHQMVALSLSISVSDNSDPAPACRIASISSNEPVNGTGDGDTGPDWATGPALSFLVRAERAGTGNGRVYTIVAECTDASGNRASALTTVRVPKSKGAQ